jgi:murein L,D-transpeptidase YafK
MRSGMLIKNLFFNLVFFTTVTGALAQMSLEEAPAKYFKAASLFSKVEDSLRNEFKEKGLEWPAKYLYVRSFKLERQLEVWVKNDWAEPFELFKVYKICATSGTFGPKRKEGDKQIPEGFYYINEFNPNSNYHLALGLNYPNPSDQILSDAGKPGGDIYIHGNCVTIGCLPITDSLIEQVYLLASIVKEQGQDFIPVHIYPYRFDYTKSAEQFLAKTKNKTELISFTQPLKEAYNFFEDTHQLPAVLVNSKGQYVVATNPLTPKVQRIRILETSDKQDPYAAWNLEEKVDKVPFFKEGNGALQKWLFNLSKELSAQLAPNTSLSLQVEFIVDKEGNTHLATVVKGGTTAINSIIKARFEKELKWNPALKDGIPVNTRLKQNLNLAAPEDLD